MTEEMKKTKKKLKHILDGNRYEHTLGVMYTSSALAMAHGYDINRAMTAGLLHDCAKCITDEEKIHLCKINGILLRKIELENPFLIHAKLGAFLAKTEYGVEDEEILHAIAVHTTGEPGMKLLDKILFISDYIEPGRDKAPNLPLIRKIAFHDLDHALYLILKDTLQFLNGRRGAVDEMTEKTFQYYNK